MDKSSNKNADNQKRCNSKPIIDKTDNQAKLPFAPAPRRAKQSVEKACEMSIPLKIASLKTQEEEKMLTKSNERASTNNLMDELDRQDADSESSGTPTTVLEIGERERKRDRKAKDKAIVAIRGTSDQLVKQPPDLNDPKQKKQAQSGSRPSSKKKCKQAVVFLPEDTVEKFLQAA